MNLCGINDVMQPLVCLGVRLACRINRVVNPFQKVAIRFHYATLINTLMPRFQLFFSDLQLIVFSPDRANHVFFVLDQGQI